MDDNFTQELLVLEEEAGYWFSVFDKLPDGSFMNSACLPKAIIINKLKAFARAYQPLVVMGKESDLIIN
ncbi:hypothetical protein [Carboxylicivirga sp. RSCT41]|uniref:hypothetical protein n=1 Tax=Carboxylicivirga agarovorans TaxID=3417570 RepID=UPI003D34663D